MALYIDRLIDRWRNFLEPTDIYTSQRIMLNLLYFVGFFPFQINESKINNRLRVSMTGYVFSVVLLSIYIGCFVTTLTFAEDANKAYQYELLGQFARAVKFLNMIVVMTSVYGSCVCMSKSISNCMRHIVHIDRKLNLIGSEIDYWKGFYFSIALTCFIFINFVLSLIVAAWQYDLLIEKFNFVAWKLWITFVANHIPLVIVSLIQCYFACIAFEIRKRFEAINRVRVIKLKNSLM